MICRVFKSSTAEAVQCWCWSIFKLISLWGTPTSTSSFGNHIEPFGSLVSLFKQTEKASSPWTTGNLWRRGCDRKETALSSWRFWRAAASGCEARIGAAYAAGVWSSAPLRPRPPIATGSFACLHTLSTIGMLRILVRYSLVILSNFCSCSSNPVVSTVLRRKESLGRAGQLCKRTNEQSW